jgi:hypothetical protein
VDTQGGLRFREFKLHTASDGQVSHYLIFNLLCSDMFI